MNSIKLDRTLGELVAESPARAAVLESLGLDFCCGGAQTLESACRDAGLDAATVGRLLANPPVAAAGTAGAEPDVRGMSLTELVDHIEQTHHVFMRTTLPRLADQAAKVTSAHGDTCPEVRAIQDVLAGLTAELEMHLDKEEQVLFPAIRALEQTGGSASFHCGDLSTPIRVMFMEHDQAGEALARLRQLSSGYTLPADACGTFEAYYAGLQGLERDLHRHIHKENNVLFPRVIERLRPSTAE